MALRSLTRCLSSLYNPTTVEHFSLHSIALQSHQTHPSLVNDLSRILSDYREPQHDLESALAPFTPQISTYLVEQVLKRCSNLGFSAQRLFRWAQEIPGFQHSKDSYHILVDILGSSREFPFLWDFLTEMKSTESCEITREIFWIVFRAYSRANLPRDAIRAFNKMLDFGIRPCLDDLDQLLFALCKRKHVKYAQELFDHVKGDDELNPSVKTYSILMRGWGEIGECGHVQKLFDEMLERGCAADLLAWNSVLDALCKGGKADEAYEVFRSMRSKGLEPDAYSYSIFIRAYCDADDVHSVFRVLDTMKRYNLVANVFTYNCIIKRLCKNRKMDEAYELLNEMIERGAKPDTWSYNTILAVHCDHNEVNMALNLITRMDKNGCDPDRHTYNMVLKMLIRIGRFDRVEKVWASMEKRGFHPAVSTYSVMIHGLCKKRGKLEEACRYFEMMIDEGIPPADTTIQVLRNKLIGFRFAEKTDILAEKMERSTCASIQEAAKVMRGNRARASVRLRNEEVYSDESEGG
ncbi:pentatricopeptide repeat-containing protein At1g52640, mitochondrial [Salvia miltiorrhiza]|uniref:pentatricopeptide repeat-containing protein At1g52640, mitochondrial n=1 Tax=Salvia miltiorrhiza TaxID=226208 RepID=UPI0025AD047D|nr:pentatricopeptide repeat-containing protein At1g52640, mitochondrial [Salvia miltiorrhiza]XP_057772868.1 pentatricopeptide repeat-containing protein At1g52640, mitochondrial [Salvia miltiorrhiza]